MKNLQKGIIDVMIIVALVWTGAVGYAVVNAEKHPEVSKFGRQ